MTTTSAKFILEIERLITSPANQALYLNADYLAVGDRKLQDTVVPLIDSLNGDFFVRTSTIPIVPGQSEYAMPSRALARKLRDVKIQNAHNIRFDFPKISIEREQIYQVNGIPFGFYFKGDKFVVVPVPTSDQYSIQYWWFLPPSQLVEVTDAAVVSSVADPDVTVVSVPATLTIGANVDFIQGTGGNQCLDIDKQIQNISGNTLTFTAGDVPSDLAAGDYISLAGTSPLVQIPDSAVPYLVTLASMDILQSLSDYEGYDRLQRIASDQEKSLKMLLEPRIEGEATKVINDFGLINRGWRGRNWGYYNSF